MTTSRVLAVATALLLESSAGVDEAWAQLPAPTELPPPPNLHPSASTSLFDVSPEFMTQVDIAVDCLNSLYASGDLPSPAIPTGTTLSIAVGTGPMQAGQSTPQGVATPARTINTDTDGDGSTDSSTIYIFETTWCALMKGAAKDHGLSAEQTKGSKWAVAIAITHELVHVENPYEDCEEGNTAYTQACVEFMATFNAIPDICKLVEKAAAAGEDTASLCMQLCAQVHECEKQRSQLTPTQVDCSCYGVDAPDINSPCPTCDECNCDDVDFEEG